MKGQYTLGDKSQRQIALCVLENFCENLLSLRQKFVAATSRKNSNWTDFVQLVAATKFCRGDKENSPVHTEEYRHKYLGCTKNGVHLLQTSDFYLGQVLNLPHLSSGQVNLQEKIANNVFFICFEWKMSTQSNLYRAQFNKTFTIKCNLQVKLLFSNP